MTKCKLTICLAIFFILLIFPGCSGYQYVASPAYVPVNVEKGTITINGNFKYYQAGYAFSNHFSVFTTGFFRYNDGGIVKSTFLSKENGGAYIQTDRHKEYTGGISYFDKKGACFSYEFLAGIGVGTMYFTNTQDLYPDYEYTLHTRRISGFFQPNVSLRWRYFDASIYGRFSRIEYYDIYANLILGARNEPEKYDQLFIDKASVSATFAEAGIQLRWGWDRIKFFLLYSRVFELSHTDIRYLEHNSYFGISLNFKIKSSQNQ